MKFEQTSCSQCGCDLGPGDSGVSHCEDHAAKHTPGPWTAEKRSGDEWWFGGKDGAEIVISRPGNKYDAVCVIGAKLSTKGAADADARLIAPAPELLNALRELMRFCESTCVVRTQEGQEIVHPTFAQARAAIAKATGEAA